MLKNINLVCDQSKHHLKITTLGMKIFRRNFSLTNSQRFKVCIIGSSGGIGQPLSLLIKSSPLVSTLILHDLNRTRGIGKDLSHINTPGTVQAFEGRRKLRESLKGCHLVLMLAGIPRQPGMTRDDLFESNAIVTKTIAEATAAECPDAFVHLVNNPINAVVPLACAIYDKLKKGKPERLFGITTLDLVRASTFVGQLKKMDPSKISVPCVGGHAGETIIPLFSQIKPKIALSEDEIEKLTVRTQNAGTEVVKAKKGGGSATLSTAFAVARTAFKFLRALKGESNIVECCYCRSNVTKCKFFSTPLLLGKNGVEKNLGLPSGLTAKEKQRIDKAVGILTKSVARGEAFAMKN